MALFVNQKDDRSELQRRLAAELQERAKQKAAKQDLPDGVEDSAYIEGTKTTTGLAWVWVAIAVIAIGIVIWLIILSL